MITGFLNGIKVLDIRFQINYKTASEVAPIFIVCEIGIPAVTLG